MWWSFQIVVILDYAFTSFIGSAPEAVSQMDAAGVGSIWESITDIFKRV